MFDEQVRWAKEEGAEFIIGETFQLMNEAMIALEVIKSYGLPAVITFGVLETPGVPKTEFSTFDGAWMECLFVMHVRSCWTMEHT